MYARSNVRSRSRKLLVPVHSLMTTVSLTAVSLTIVFLTAAGLSTLAALGTARAGDVSATAGVAAVTALEAYLKVDVAEREPLGDQPFATVGLSRLEAERARDLLWADHVSRIRKNRSKEMDARVVKDGEMKMPFYYKVFGEKPKNGRSLYISMHGGGGAPARVNDRQWENQKALYQLEEGVYVAPRAPTDTWNLWHQSHIDVLFGRLIEDLIVFEDVDPDRVYIMGYSAGGDGAFQLAPRMADRLAAAAVMAGHPNETSPVGLRNLPFTLHMGGKDSAYKRNEVAGQWKKKLAALREADSEGYEHWVKIYPNKGHWMDREDAAAIPWMAKFTRNRLPERIIWKQDDVRHDRFYWLATDPKQAEDRAEVTATRAGAHFSVQATGVKRLTLLLNDQMTDLDQPMTVTSLGTGQVGGQQEATLFTGTVKRTIQVLARTLAERGDPKDIFSSEVTVSFGPTSSPAPSGS